MDENATESKEAKAQTLAKRRDKKGVSLVPIGDGSNQAHYGRA